jgi:hypothetical protein
MSLDRRKEQWRPHEQDPAKVGPRCLIDLSLS